MKKNSGLLKDFLEQFVSTPKIARKYNAFKVAHIWEERMGESISAYTEKIYLKGDVIYIHILSSALKNELMMNRQKILELFQNQLGEELVKEVKIY